MDIRRETIEFLGASLSMADRLLLGWVVADFEGEIEALREIDRPEEERYFPTERLMAEFAAIDVPAAPVQVPEGTASRPEISRGDLVEAVRLYGDGMTLADVATRLGCEKSDISKFIETYEAQYRETPTAKRKAFLVALLTNKDGK
jgi:hypothetical protein